jgi:hypothetical protein
MDENLIIKADYIPSVKVYDIVRPAIESDNVYFFTTDCSLRYEVMFGKKNDNYLGHVVNFSVLSDEFEDEYSVTNKGEVFKVVATVVEIIRIFHSMHHQSDSYEFSGEFKDNRDTGETSIRTRLYHRYATRVLCPNWKIELQGNRATIRKIRS